jgi:hypothetical protein
MTTYELVTLVQRAVKDGSFSEQEIVDLLNEALMAVSFEFCLPELEATEEISFAVGDDSVALPDDYHHDLWHIEPLTRPGRINIHTSLRSLQRIYRDTDTGNGIKDAAVDGLTLHVRPVVGETQDVRVHYYRTPEALHMGDMTATPATQPNSPEGIPAHLHSALLVNYAAARLFDIIEDGIDGGKNNTRRYEEKYMGEGLRQLERYAKRAPRLTPYIKRHPRFL